MAGFLDLPHRSSKPREQGITHVLDRGLSRRRRSTAMVEVAGDAVDIVKLGWGTALVTRTSSRSSSATASTASRSCSAAR